jgi:predicted phage baseplate assembly protein
MPLQAPNLDDRNFAQLVAEAKTLIPRYAPEWTDHNESDPGITLVQLFAWMTDLLLYRVNQIPERNYIEFLRLLGIELEPAHPAKVELTFKLARNDLEYAVVPVGTQVVAGDSGGGGAANAPLVFETDESLIALGAQLKAIQSFDGFSYSVETTKNTAAGQYYYPFGPYAREGSAILLGFDSPLAFTSQQINLTVYTHTQDVRPENQHCDLDLSQMPLPATLIWEYWDGHFWQSFTLAKDETRAFTRSGHIYFSGPGDRLKKSILGHVSDSLYWIRARVDRSTYETAPRLNMIMTNTVTATQALTMRDEVLGGSNGRPHQAFKLSSIPVVVSDKPLEVRRADGSVANVTSLRLEIDEGHGFEVWQEVSDFYSSGPDDPHYLLDRTTGEILLGDGKHGRIPVANPANANSNIVARKYRYGGGKRGNVGIGTVTELQTSVASVDTVNNFHAAYGGSDEETLDEAKLRAPLALKSKERAVTAEDFAYLAKATPGALIRRARALPLVHPEFPEAQIPGVVTVLVVPDSDSPRPLPSPATLKLVCAHLNLHRLLTAEVYVVAPVYRLVKIEADIVVRQDADLAEVQHAIEDNLTRYFHPLKGGENGNGWEFGGEIFYSDVYRVVLQTPGVSRIRENQLLIWLDDERQIFCRDVPIGQGELLYSEGHEIRVSYF